MEIKKAKDFEKQGKLEEAIKAYKDALNLYTDKQNESVWCNLRIGELQFKLNLFEEATRSFQKTIKIWQEFDRLSPRPLAVAYRGWIYSLDELNRLEEALSIVDRAVSDLQEIRSNSTFPPLSYISILVKIYSRKIKIQKQIGNFDEGFKQLEQILTTDLRDLILKEIYLPVNLKNSIAPKYYQEKALAILESINLDCDCQLLLSMSVLAMQIGELEKAETYADTAIRINEDNTSSIYLEKGRILQARKQWDKAIPFYRKVDKPQSLINLLTCIYESNQFTKEDLESEVLQLIQNSKAIAFIKEKILSNLDIDYDKCLILYQVAGNVGDTCKQLALIKPLCIQHNKKAIVFYPNKESSIIQANLFLDSITPQYIASHFPIDLDTEQTINRLMSKDTIYLWAIPVIPGIPRIVGYDLEIKKLTYIINESIYKAGKAANIGINIDLNNDNLGKPIITKKHFNNALEKFNNLQLDQGNSVLIAPHSVTQNHITGSNSRAIKFWQRLIDKLSSKNLIPVINARHHGGMINYLSKMFTNKEVKFADISLDEIIPFVELCGGFIGIRSGLCDLLAFSDKKVAKLCINANNSGNSDFQKLKNDKMPDSTIINDNFNIYNLSLEQPLQEKDISQIVKIISNKS